MKNEKLKMKNYNEKFKIDILNRAYALALNYIRFSETLSNKSSLQIMSNQLLRSITSIGANIVEAQTCGSRKEFTNYIRHALKSANESKFWLYLLEDSHLVEIPIPRSLLDEVTEISSILGASVISLKSQKHNL